MTRKLLNLINNRSKDLEPNKKFLVDVMTSIERLDSSNRRKPSRYYKPSSLKCMRNMYFTRVGADTDKADSQYSMIGMADTGTRRHEAIQDVLLQLKELGTDWEYVDVAKYVENKQKFGKCKNLKVKGVAGAETHLIDTTLNLSFRCDGIIRRISTNEYYLFEMKNVTSFKYAKVENQPLEEHHNQVICYCTALDLNKAFVLYENRDFCTLECTLFEVTEDMKEWLVSYIMECEGYVERLIAPPKVDDSKVCRYCNYKTICRKIS